MIDKFRNKYRIPSARLQNWDYGANGAYFITICTKEMKHFFGTITDDEMHLNAEGELAEKYWMEIPDHFPYIELGNFQIMPNHMHGILIINKLHSDIVAAVQTRFIASPTELIEKETRLIASVQGGFAGDMNPMLNDNISRASRWYKGRCSFEIHKINSKFEWHVRFHDHIIRNAEEFERIQNYIAENPSKWKEDKFFRL
jgi:putative transposase